MAIRARNNLSPASQQWAREVQTSVDTALQQSTRALNQAQSGSRQTSNVSQQVVNLSSRVVPIQASTQSSSGAMSLIVPTPLDLTYTFLTLAIQCSTEESFSTSGSARFARIEAFWMNFVQPLTSRAVASYVIRPGETVAWPSVTLVGTIRQSDIELYLGESPFVSLTTDVSSVASGGYTGGVSNISGSLTYSREI